MLVFVLDRPNALAIAKTKTGARDAPVFIA
jgi:hypothetical protein